MALLCRAPVLVCRVCGGGTGGLWGGPLDGVTGGFPLTGGCWPLYRLARPGGAVYSQPAWPLLPSASTAFQPRSRSVPPKYSTSGSPALWAATNARGSRGSKSAPVETAWSSDFTASGGMACAPRCRYPWTTTRPSSHPCGTRSPSWCCNQVASRSSGPCGFNSGPAVVAGVSPCFSWRQALLPVGQR